MDNMPVEEGPIPAVKVDYPNCILSAYAALHARFVLAKGLLFLSLVLVSKDVTC